jgi:hypothetical protein
VTLRVASEATAAGGQAQVCRAEDRRDLQVALAQRCISLLSETDKTFGSALNVISDPQRSQVKADLTHGASYLGMI